MPETVTILKEDFDLLCQIMQGLCVPASMGAGMLGAAYAPWSELHGKRAFGYPEASEYADAMVKAAQVSA